MIRVLHITPWYPSESNTVEGVFIERLIHALTPHVENSLLHIRFGKKERKFKFDTEGVPCHQITLKPILDKWRLKEISAHNLIRDFLKKRPNEYDIVNFFIAYPNATYLKKLKAEFPNMKFSIMEHWSAYHRNFDLPKGSKGRNRIEQIFNNKAPLITVSHALGQDIRNFCGMDDLPYTVVPNIVDETFKFKPKPPSENFTFCSINSWSSVKNPFVLIDAIAILKKEHPNVRLVLGGTGLLLEQMKSKIIDLNLEETIRLTGYLNFEAVVELLQDSQVYCQSSKYETFSAITAEALSTGTPVMVTNVGGMKEFVDDSNGIRVDGLDPQIWALKMKDMMTKYDRFDCEAFSKTAHEKFTAPHVGRRFANELYRLMDNEG